MKFGEKLKQARLKAGMTQEELGTAADVTKRTIINYETCSRYPRDRGVYARLSAALGCEVNYLLTEDEEFITEAGAKYGSSGETEARRLLERSAALFAGGELGDEDKLAFPAGNPAALSGIKGKRQKYAPKRNKNG